MLTSTLVFLIETAAGLFTVVLLLRFYLQWARADQMAWTSLTTANVAVEARQMQKNKLNDAWANTLLWRMRVGWRGDPPGTYTTGPTGIVVTLSLTAP